MKKKYSIRNNILVVVILSLVIEIGLMIFFFIQYGIFTKNEAIMTYKNDAVQIMGEFSRTEQEIEKIAF